MAPSVILKLVLGLKLDKTWNCGTKSVFCALINCGRFDLQRRLLSSMSFYYEELHLKSQLSMITVLWFLPWRFSMPNYGSPKERGSCFKFY